MVKFRFYVLIFLILSFILSNSFFGTYDFLILNKARNTSISFPNDISFLKSSEKYLTNDYFLGNNLLGEVNFSNQIIKAPVLTDAMTKLTSRLKNLAAKNLQIEPGIFIYDFYTGRYVTINADKEFPTASMIKIPILFQLFRRIDEGLVNLNDKMSLTDYYITEGSGLLQYKPIGTHLQVLNLAQKMIQESDNTATNMLLSIIGGVNSFNRAVKFWGFSSTHMSSWLPDLEGTNVATPRDFGKLLYNIDNPDFLSLQSRAKIIEIMSNVKNRFLIQAGLPDNAQFIHKTGDIGRMLGDAGIIILPDGRKYIMVVMAKRPWNSYAAKQFIIDASKITYNSYVTNDL
ncbi:MAG: class A beta-lactamase-related serine hydrolase [Candidatus Gastranaerophilales bacterium]|nr:class A beta-lactamase-related serine hydrolase [Candidatus Gastranaerophilales bacterium]